MQNNNFIRNTPAQLRGKAFIGSLTANLILVDVGIIVLWLGGLVFIRESSYHIVIKVLLFLIFTGIALYGLWFLYSRIAFLAQYNDYNFW